MRASRATLSCGKRACVCTYARRIVRGDSRANQRAFVLRMNGSRCAHGVALTSVELVCKIESVRKISRGHDRMSRLERS